MKGIRTEGLAIFILFLGIAMFASFQTNSWLNAAFWVAIGLLFLFLPRVTLPAHVGNRSDARRRRAVIAMTVVTGWRGQILLFVDGPGVDARLVLLILVTRNSEWTPGRMEIPPRRAGRLARIYFVPGPAGLS